MEMLILTLLNARFFPSSLKKKISMAAVETLNGDPKVATQAGVATADVEATVVAAVAATSPREALEQAEAAEAATKKVAQAAEVATQEVATAAKAAVEVLAQNGEVATKTQAAQEVAMAVEAMVAPPHTTRMVKSQLVVKVAMVPQATELQDSLLSLHPLNLAQITRYL
jgi:crotonobetainyl-CoA:carnitine CoA-transferase CaiB-like acyl-CoA transferase